jgi:hypothetical protein
VSYLEFVWTPNGYEFHEHEGDPPQVGAEVQEDSGRFVVAKVAASPLPGDARRCAYLQPAR